MVPRNSKLGTTRRTTLLAGPRGWRLAPEGAAIHLAERTAVVADVHLGYEWARAAGGDQVPPHSLGETLAKLSGLLDRSPIVRLVVAGDLTESSGPCPRTDRDLRELVGWLAGRGVSLELAMGNHDRPRRPAWPSTVEVGGWTVGHGHRPIAGARIVFGHHHPSLKTEGIAAPCFLVGSRAMVLPAFSPNAAGVDFRALTMTGVDWGTTPRCVAGVGEELLDFGPVDALRLRLGGR